MVDKVLEAARKLVSRPDWPLYGEKRGDVCVVCGEHDGGSTPIVFPHAADCPWLLLREAVEAASKKEEPAPEVAIPPIELQHPVECPTCGGETPDRPVMDRRHKFGSPERYCRDPRHAEAAKREVRS